ncbi:hypothetical protein RB597_002086 [Gaeumannomyces tritici]
MIEESIEGSDLYDAPPQPQRRSRRISVPLNDPPDSGDDPAAFQDGLQDKKEHRSGFAKVDELVETIHKRFDSLEKTNESFVTQINQHPAAASNPTAAGIRSQPTPNRARRTLGCGGASGYGISELILDHGTVMLDSRLSKTPSRTAWWLALSVAHTMAPKNWLAPLYAGRNASFASISASVANFSSALSDSMRTTGAGPDAPRREDPDAPFVRGVVMGSTLCIRFVWPWLLLPAALTVAAAAMLAVMIAQGYLEPGQPTWKSSILPLLLYGLQGLGHGDGRKDDDEGGSGGGDSRRPELLDLKGVEGISKMVPARFDRGERAFVTTAEWPDGGTELADRGGRVRVKRLSQDSLLQSR